MRIALLSSYDNAFGEELAVLFNKGCKYAVQQRATWISSYIEHFLSNKNVHFLTVRDDEGALISCLCLQTSTRSFYRFWTYKRLLDLGNGVNDFFYIPCVEGYEKEAAHLLVEWLWNNWRFWDRMTLSFLPQTPMHTAFVQAMDGYFEVSVSKDRCYYLIDTNRPWHEYFTPEMNQRLRDVRGRFNRVKRSGHEIISKIVEEGIEDYLPDFLHHFAVRRRTKGERNSYESNAKIQLIKDVIRGSRDDVSVVLSVLEDRSGCIWAYQLDLLDKGRGIWYHYAPAFNASFREFSPSKLLLFESLQRAFNDPRIVEFNFMRGEAEYKKQFTDQFDTYLNIDVINGRSYKVRAQRQLARLVRK